LHHVIWLLYEIRQLKFENNFLRAKTKALSCLTESSSYLNNHTFK